MRLLQTSAQSGVVFSRDPNVIRSCVDLLTFGPLNLICYGITSLGILTYASGQETYCLIRERLERSSVSRPKHPITNEQLNPDRHRAKSDVVAVVTRMFAP